MSHALTLALVYALVLHAGVLCHAAAAGWVVKRQVPVTAATLVAAVLAAVIGMAVAVAAVTTMFATASAAGGGLSVIAWLCGSCLLLLALVACEMTQTGVLWRAMGANARGLLVIGVLPAVATPFVMGMGLASFAGMLAPPLDPTVWVPLATLALLATALPGRPRGWAVRGVLAAWLLGAAIGGLELVFPPSAHALLVSLIGLGALWIAAPHLRLGTL